MNWPGEEIASYLSWYLGYEGSVGISTPTTALGGGRSYCVTTGVSVEDNIVTITAEGDFTGYSEELLDNGWYFEATDSYRSSYHSEDLDLTATV